MFSELYDSLKPLMTMKQSDELLCRAEMILTSKMIELLLRTDIDFNRSMIKFTVTSEQNSLNVNPANVYTEGLLRQLELEEEENWVERRNW